MIMGANFGTSITNTIVALAHARRRDEFKQAFAVSTCDDFFELCSLTVLLPLEVTTGLIQKTAERLSSSLSGVGGMKFRGPLDSALDGGWNRIRGVVEQGFESPSPTLVVVLLLLRGVLIYGGLVLLVGLLRSHAQSRATAAIRWTLDRPAPMGMLVGLLATVMVQSSSVTTSLLVPLAGAGLLSLERAFPVVLGANLGTTMTALMAALAATGQNAAAGLTIALAHLTYNVLGISLIYGLPPLRKIPLGLSRWMANQSESSVSRAILYTVLLFYGVPGLVAWLMR